MILKLFLKWKAEGVLSERPPHLWWSGPSWDHPKILVWCPDSSISINIFMRVIVSWWINLFDFSNETHEWCLELDLDNWMDHSRHPSNQTQNWAGLDVLFFYRFHLCGNCIFTLLVRILIPRAWKIRSIGTPSPHRFFVILLMSLRRLSSMDQQLPAVMKRYWQWNFGATGAGAPIQTSQSWNPTSWTVNLPSLHIFCRKTGWYHHRRCIRLCEHILYLVLGQGLDWIDLSFFFLCQLRRILSSLNCGFGKLLLVLTCQPSVCDVRMHFILKHPSPSVFTTFNLQKGLVITHPVQYEITIWQVFHPSRKTTSTQT